MSRIAKFSTLALLITVTIVSCKKDFSGSGTELTDQEEQQAAQISTESSAEADFVFNDVFDNVIGVNNEVGVEGAGVFGRTAGGQFNTDPFARGDSANRCFTVTISHTAAPAFFPVKIILDFGNGCTGADGHTRSGKVITTYSARLFVPGATATTSFENFYFDSIRVEGTHTIHNTSSSQVPQMKISVVGAKLTKPNGNYINWDNEKTITQTDGMGTSIFPLDDVFSIEASGHGKVKRGDLLVAWNTETVEPLIKRFNCRWIVKGVVRVARLNLSTNSPWVARLNYGTGDCDNKAILTINGVSVQITLP